MQVAELSGGLLDFWVAKALQIPSARLLGAGAPGLGWCEISVGKYSPSTDGKHAQHIFETHDISVVAPQAEGGFFVASANGGQEQQGQSYLEAAMRAVVSWHFGIRLPEEKTS